MTHRNLDAVQQLATGSGTGALTLGAVTSAEYRTMTTAGMTNGDTAYARIQHATIPAEWEMVLITYNAGAITRSFDSVSKSATGSLISFSTGNKVVTVVAPAGRSVVGDNNGDTLIGNVTRSHYGSTATVTMGDSAAQWSEIDMLGSGPYGGYIYADSITNELAISVAGGNGIIYLLDGATAVARFSIARNDSRVPTFFQGVGTTASGANAFLDSGSSPANQLLRSTSSLAYKRDIEPMQPQYADAVIERAQPIFYKSLAPADNPDWTFYGLGAEQLAEIEPRLVNYGYASDAYEEYDEQVMVHERSKSLVDETGRPIMVKVARTVRSRRLKEGAEKVPDGVAYDRLTVMLLDVVRRLVARVGALESEVSALKG